MKVIALYRPHSEHERKIEDYIRDFKRHSGKDIELISLDTRDGASKARTWDVVRYPALVAIDDAGHVKKVWQDEMLPLLNEVSWYYQNQ